MFMKRNELAAIVSAFFAGGLAAYLLLPLRLPRVAPLRQHVSNHARQAEHLSLAEALQAATAASTGDGAVYPLRCAADPSHWLCTSVLVTNVDSAAAAAYLPYFMLALALGRLEAMVRRLLVDCLDDEAYALCRRYHLRPELCLLKVRGASIGW